MAEKVQNQEVEIKNMHELKLTVRKEDGLTIMVVEDGQPLLLEEKERIKGEWEKPENQGKLEQLARKFGEYKKIIDQETGIAYKVPTIDILTKGLNYKDLPNYPRWEE